LKEIKTVTNETAEATRETKVKLTFIRERQRDLANEITMKLTEITFGRPKTELKRSQTRELEGSIERDENKFEYESFEDIDCTVQTDADKRTSDMKKMKSKCSRKKIWSI